MPKAVNVIRGERKRGVMSDLAYQVHMLWSAKEKT